MTTRWRLPLPTRAATIPRHRSTAIHRQAKNGRNGQEVDSLRPIGHGLAKGLSALTDPVTRSNAILWVAAYLANGRKTARETGDVKHRIDAMKQNETLWKDLIAQVPTFSVEHAVPAQRQILLALAEEIYPAGLTKEQVANLYQPLNGVLHRVRSMVKENEIGSVNRDIAQVIIDRLETAATLDERLILAPAPESMDREIISAPDAEYADDLERCIARLNTFASPNTLQYLDAMVASQLMRMPGIDTKILSSTVELAAYVEAFPDPPRVFSAVLADLKHASAVNVEIRAEKQVSIAVIDSLDDRDYAMSLTVGIGVFAQEMKQKGWNVFTDERASQLNMTGMQRDDDSCGHYAQRYIGYLHRNAHVPTETLPVDIFKIAQRRTNAAALHKDKMPDAWDNQVINKKGQTVVQHGKGMDEKMQSLRQQALKDLKALQRNDDKGAAAWAELQRRIRPSSLPDNRWTDEKIGARHYDSYLSVFEEDDDLTFSAADWSKTGAD